VMRTIRRDPDKRYKSIDELLYDLRHLNEVLPVQYKPDTPTAPVMRQRVILVTLLIILICLAIIAIGFLLQYAHHVVH
jgi:eukaryotic-like serine/threonine-protein kinase